jgi:hypothetical protein
MREQTDEPSLRLFGQRVSCLVWSAPVRSACEQVLGCTWLDGGCHTLARALLGFLRAWKQQVSLAIVLQKDAESQGDWAIRHVLLVWQAEARRWYLDANGLQTAAEVEAFWGQRRPGLVILEDVLADLDELSLAEWEVPSDAVVVEWLLQLFWSVLVPAPLARASEQSGPAGSRGLLR